VLRAVVALILMIPYVIPLSVSIDTQSAYVAMVAFTLCPTLGLGNVLYGSMDITYNKWFGYNPPQPTASVKSEPEHGQLMNAPPQIIIIQ